MRIILLIAFIASGILFVWSVLMMSPKGWLGAGIAWFGWASGDYGSKKSVETTLKKVAIVTSIIFVAVSILLPYVQE